MVGSHELGSLHSWEHVGKKRKRRKNGLCACSNIPYLFQLCFSLRFLCYALVVGLSKAEDTIRLETNSTWHLVENSSLVLGPTLTVNNFNASDTVQLLLNVSAGGFRNRLSPTDSLMTLYFNDTSEYINNALQDWEYVPPLHWNSQLGGEETLSMKAGIAPDWQINESIPIVTWSKNNAPIIHLLNLTIVYGMEDERLILEGVSVEEVDAGEDPSGVMEITLSVEHGTIDILTVGGLWVIYNIKPQYGCGHTLIFRGNVVQVNEALGGLSYMGPENWSGIDKLTIHVNDLGNTGVGGTLTARGNIDVVIQAVNDAPQIQAPFSVLDMDEDEVLPIRGITVSDEEELESLFKFQVSVSIHTLGAGGTLKFPPQVEGAQLISGAWFTSSHVEFLALPHAIRALLENLTFTPFPNANELSCGITVIEWTVSDLGCCGSGGQGTDTLILKIRVRAVNDAPTLSIPPYINIQQDELEILPGIEVEDIDARENPSSLIQVNITVENGSLQFLGGLHNNAGLWVKNDGSNGFLQFFGTVDLVKAALQTIAYRGFYGWSGTDHLTVSVDDLGNTGRGGALTVTQKSVINVEKNTRIIVISAPSVLEVEEDGELPLSPLFTTSVLSGEVRVVMLSVEVSNGQLESPFSTTTTTHSGWAALELVIPVSNIGDVLASISYVPYADWNGVDNIRIYMSDKQAGGGVTPLLSSFIHVVPIPDAPNITYLAPDNPLVYTHSNGAIRIEGLSVKDADAKNWATAELILLNVTSTSGLGVPRFRRGLHVYGLSFPAGGLGLGSSAGGYYNSSLVVTGTYCAINIALQELLYESNSQAQADNDMLEVTVSRSGLSSIVTVSIPLHHSSSPPISIQGAPLITKIPGDNSIRILSDLEISFDMENIDNVLGLAQLH